MTNDVEYLFSTYLSSIYIFGEANAGGQLARSQFSLQGPLHGYSGLSHSVLAFPECECPQQREKVRQTPYSFCDLVSEVTSHLFDYTLSTKPRIHV